MSEPKKLPEARFFTAIPDGYLRPAHTVAGLVIVGKDRPPLVWNGAEWELLKAEPQSPRPAPGNTAH